MRGAVVFALASALLIAPLTSASPATAAIDDETDATGPTVSVTAGVHGVVQPDSAVGSIISIDNSSDDDIAAGLVSLDIDRTPLADSAALSAWLDAGASAGEFSSLGIELTEQIPASESLTVSLIATPAAVGTLADGIYPLRATFTSGAVTDADSPAPSTASADTVLIVESGTARQVSLVVPITATPENGALLTADELTALTAPNGALSAQLDGVAGTAAVLAIDPLIPAAIRVLGSAAPHGAVAWLERLEDLANERFLLQAGDADATVQARAGLAELLQPLAFTSYIDAADFVVPVATAAPAPVSTTASPTPAPTGTAEPVEPTIPTTDELLSLPAAETGILWPIGDVQTADLAVLSEFVGGDATTIVPSTSISGVTGAALEIDGERVLALDAASSAALSDAAAEEDGTAREQAIVTAIAELSLSGSGSALIGLERDEHRTADALRDAILAVSAVSDPVGIDALRSAPAASATLTAPVGEDRTGALHALLDDEARLTAFSSILDEPLVLRAPERLELLRLIAVADDDADTFSTAVADHRAATVATLDAVGVQQPSPIQLLTSAAPLPVWIRNDLPWPVNVTLTSIPSDARLDVQPITAVVAQPNNNERVKVPVEARVGSGSLNVRFSLTSPTGVHVGTDQTASVTVRAEWESIGLVVLGVLIGLLLVLGVIRTVVRRRRGGADAAGSGAETSDAAGSGAETSDAAPEEGPNG